MTVKVKLMENGKLPQMKHSGDACYDCYANESVMIPNMQSRTVKLGFAMQIPADWEIQIRPRSGLSSKGITAEWGTGDSCYRGQYATTLFNHSGADFTINHGDRICQMAIRQIPGKNSAHSEASSAEYNLKMSGLCSRIYNGKNVGKVNKEKLKIAIMHLINAVKLLADSSIEFEVVDELEESERGECGFGSSGI